MVMSTPILDSAANLMSVAVLVDTVELYNVGATQTTGYTVTRPLTLIAGDLRALVQTTVLQNAVESEVSNAYSVKVERGTDIQAGQAIKVIGCVQEPELVGKTLLLDKVSENGLALIRKAVASDFHAVDQQGKEGI